MIIYVQIYTSYMELKRTLSSPLGLLNMLDILVIFMIFMDMLDMLVYVYLTDNNHDNYDIYININIQNGLYIDIQSIF